MAHLRPVFLGDDLFACQPIAAAVQQAGGNFIFTCKPASHPTITEYLYGVELEEHRQTIVVRSKRATTLSLNCCPYRATLVFHRPLMFRSYPGGNFSDTGGSSVSLACSACHLCQLRHIDARPRHAKSSRFSGSGTRKTISPLWMRMCEMPSAGLCSKRKRRPAPQRQTAERQRERQCVGGRRRSCRGYVPGRLHRQVARQSVRSARASEKIEDQDQNAESRHEFGRNAP